MEGRTFIDFDITPDGVVANAGQDGVEVHIPLSCDEFLGLLGLMVQAAEALV